MTASTTDLMHRLWPRDGSQPGDQVYAIVDGARAPRILDMLQTIALESTCLFSGPLSPALQRAAPYLVQLSPDTPPTHRLLEQCWEAGWIILIVTPAYVTLMQLRRHVRTLLRVRDENGHVFMFRFFDPRVLRTYLPTCTASEAARFFGPITAFVCQSECHGIPLTFSRERLPRDDERLPTTDLVGNGHA